MENKKMTTDFEGNVILIKNVASNKLASDFVQPTYNYNKKSTSQLKDNLNTRGPSENNIVHISNDKPNKQLQSENQNIITKITPVNTDEGNERKIIQPIGSNFELDLIYLVYLYQKLGLRSKKVININLEGKTLSLFITSNQNMIIFHT